MAVSKNFNIWLKYELKKSNTGNQADFCWTNNNLYLKLFSGLVPFLFIWNFTSNLARIKLVYCIWHIL
jgi:hypothetical protein